MLGLTSVLQWSCTGSTPRDQNFGKEAGRDFEAPIEGTGGAGGVDMDGAAATGGAPGTGGGEGGAAAGTGGTTSDDASVDDSSAGDEVGDAWQGGARARLASTQSWPAAAGPAQKGWRHG